VLFVTGMIILLTIAALPEEFVLPVAVHYGIMINFNALNLPKQAV
jgi:hypothetical protein